MNETKISMEVAYKELSAQHEMVKQRGLYLAQALDDARKENERLKATIENMKPEEKTKK